MVKVRAAPWVQRHPPGSPEGAARSDLCPGVTSGWWHFAS